MDRSLDEIISDRPAQRGGRSRPDRRAPPPPRAPRRDAREDYPRDGVRKHRRDEPTNIDTDWVHDRFEEDHQNRRRGGGRQEGRDDDRAPPLDLRTSEGEGSKIRVDNIHYDISEVDVKELFERIGPLASVRMLYDRMDRSQGTAFVTFVDPRDARDAVREYDGANAQGQPIRLTLIPNGPALDSRGPAPNKGSLFERVERPTRSLFDRIEGGPREDSRDAPRRRGGGRQDRSFSPEKDRNLRVPDNVDRYVPGQRDSRSPIGGRRGGGRERGRRPGARREESGRGGGRGGRRGGGGGGGDGAERPSGPRPRKTAEQLDAEMDDYFGGGGGAENGNGNGNGAAAAAQNGSAPAAARDDDIDMIE